MGHAVLEYGHNRRTQIMTAKKKTATNPETSDPCFKYVQQVCFDTGHAILEYYNQNPWPQHAHDKDPCLMAWAWSGRSSKYPS